MLEFLDAALCKKCHESHSIFKLCQPILDSIMKDPKYDKIEEIKSFKPDPALMQMTERIIDQNTLILEINARLLALFSTTVIVNSKNEEA